MLREQSKSRINIGKTLLEVSALVVQVCNVVEWFKQEGAESDCLLEIVFRLLNIAFAQFEYAQVIVRLCMRCIVTHCNLKGLVR